MELKIKLAHVNQLMENKVSKFISTIESLTLAHDYMNLSILLKKLKSIPNKFVKHKLLNRLRNIILSFLFSYYKNLDVSMLSLLYFNDCQYNQPNFNFRLYSEILIKILVYYQNHLNYSLFKKTLLSEISLNDNFLIDISQNIYLTYKHYLIDKLYYILSTKTPIPFELFSLIPFKYLNDDIELQKAYFNLFLTHEHLYHYIFIISKILFKNHVNSKIDMVQLISCLFTKLTELTLNGINQLDTLIQNVVYLLFLDEFKSYRQITEYYFSIFIQKLIKFYGNNQNQTIYVIKRCFWYFCDFMCIKEYDNCKMKYRRIIYKYHQKIEQYQRFLYIIEKYFLNFFKFFFLSGTKGTNQILRYFFEILSVSSHDNIIEKIDIKSWFTYLKEDNQIKFMKNLRAAFPFLISQIHLPQILSFLKNSITFMKSLLSQKNQQIILKILKLLPVLYFYCLKLKEDSNNNIKYEQFFNYLSEEAINLFSLSVRLINDIEEVEAFRMYFFFFVLSLSRFLSPLSKEIIKKTFTQYLIETKNPNLFEIAYYPFTNYEDIWNCVYTNLISFDENTNYDIKPYCLYSDERIKHLSIKNIDSDTKAFFLSVNNYFNLTNQNINLYKEQIYLFIYAISNSSLFENIEFLARVTTTIFYLVSGLNNENNINNICNQNIKYPSEEILNFVINFYEDIILPYENYIRRNKIHEINPNILYLYGYYLCSIPYHCTNVFMKLEGEEETTIDDKLYNKLKNLVRNSVEFAKVIMNEIRFRRNIQNLEELKILFFTVIQLDIKTLFYVNKLGTPYIFNDNSSKYINKHLNTLWDKFYFPEIDKYEENNCLIDLCNKMNPRDFIAPELFEKILYNNEVDDLEKPLDTFYDYSLSSLDMKNSYRESLKRVMIDTFEIIQGLIYSGIEREMLNDTIEQLIIPFRKASVILLSEPNCDCLDIFIELKKITLLIMSNTVRPLQFLEKVIISISEGISKYLLLHEGPEYKNKALIISTILCYPELFYHSILEFKNSNSINRDRIILSFLDNNIKTLSQNYSLVQDNKNSYMNKIEQFIFVQILDLDIQRNIKAKYIGVLYSLLKEKIKKYRQNQKK